MPEVLKTIAEQLHSVEINPPTVRTGMLDDPLFLGMIPTRNCNLGCRYCDFAAPKLDGPVMSLDTARQTIDAYLNLLKAAGRDYGEVHLFGGEPFFAMEVVQFIVEYATLGASELKLNIHFEAITNGIYNSKSCRWIADYFDTIILSLDGPAEIQERQRPARNGHNPFSTIIRNARVFSEAAVELIIRVCVTSQTVGRMAEIAAWLGEEFRPSTVCFETLTESQLSRASGLMPPSPWEFVRQFVDATRVLDRYGIEIVLSTTNMQNIQTSFCPVGKDALIVSPDGTLHACYLLPEDWSRNNLDLRFGRVAEGRFEIDDQALQRIRSLSVYDKALCSNCLCRYHCAGGCHVNHHLAGAKHYDDLCIQTRLITIAKLLLQMKQDELVDEWLTNRPAMEASVMQPTDRLFRLEPIP
ncbi:MAG: radical SAM protein [Chloroflexota bacterium]